MNSVGDSMLEKRKQCVLQNEIMRGTISKKNFQKIELIFCTCPGSLILITKQDPSSTTFVLGRHCPPSFSRKVHLWGFIQLFCWTLREHPGFQKASYCHLTKLGRLNKWFQTCFIDLRLAASSEPKHSLLKSTGRVREAHGTHLKNNSGNSLKF